MAVAYAAGITAAQVACLAWTGASSYNIGRDGLERMETKQKKVTQMFWKMLHKERRVVQFYTLILFIVLSAVFLAATLYSQYNADQIERNKAVISEQSLVDVEKQSSLIKSAGTSPICCTLRTACF